MCPAGSNFKSMMYRLLAAAGAVAVVTCPAQAVLVHKYTFNNGNASDSVGTADGIVVDNTGISSYTGGALDLTRNDDLSSAQIFTNPTTVGAFVDLPNGVFSAAAAGGTLGAVTVETWVTVQQNRTWARVWDFGTSGPGEGLSGDSPNAPYVFVAPQIGNGPARAAGVTHNTADTPAAAPTPLTLNVKHHLVFTLDQNDLTGSANGTAKFYVNNAPPIVAGISSGLILHLMNDNNNWIGRAQWGDPLFDGTIDEFRIYDSALTAAEVDASRIAGPEPAPLPSLTVDRSTGAVSLTNTTGTVPLVCCSPRDPLTPDYMRQSSVEWKPTKLSARRRALSVTQLSVRRKPTAARPFGRSTT